MARRLSLKKKLLLSTLVGLLTLVIAITGLEVFGYYQQPVLLKGKLVEDFHVNHMWRPNSEFVHDEFVTHNPDFPQPYKHVFNSQSFIETYDVQKEKPGDTFRIFYLGDSFTEGCAPMDQTVPGLVETELNRLAQERKKPLRFEVINTGTMSYSPLIFYVLLRHRILPFSPDLVVIQVDMTDDFDDWKYAKTAIYDENGDPWAVPPRNPYEAAFFDSTKGVVEASFWTRTQLFLVRNSYFYNWLIADKKTTEGGWAPDKPGQAAQPARENDAEIYNRWSWCKPEWDPWTQKQAGKTLAMLEKIAKLCRDNGVKLVLTGVPHYPQFASSYSGQWPPMWSNRPHIEIAKVAAKCGVPFVDAWSALLPHVKGTPQRAFYYHRDIHLNPRGYALWAKAQLEVLLDPRRELLPAAFFQ